TGATALRGPVLTHARRLGGWHVSHRIRLDEVGRGHGDDGDRIVRALQTRVAMVTKTQEDFAAIWRPVFSGGFPEDSAVAEAWARTRQLFVEEYGARLTDLQKQHMIGEMTIAWLVRALSPSASAADTERATLAQQVALWLGQFRYDLDRLYTGYYDL